MKLFSRFQIEICLMKLHYKMTIFCGKLQHFPFKLGLSPSRFGSVPIKFPIYEKKMEHTSFAAPHQNHDDTARIRRLETRYTKCKCTSYIQGLFLNCGERILPKTDSMCAGACACVETNVHVYVCL